MIAALRAARAHVATRRREIAATASLMLPAFVADIAIVTTGHTSISERTWAACDAHPLIAVAGMLAALVPMYLTRRSWPCAGAWAALGAHLFTFVGAR